MTEKQFLNSEEEVFKDLCDNANDLMQSVTPDGSLRWVNKAWLKTLGYDEKQITGMTIFDIIHPDELEHCQHLFKKVMSGEDVGRITTAFVSKDSNKIFVEGEVNCKFDQGKPIYTRAIFRNINERKRAQEVQERLSQQLQAKVRELEAFSYGVAHDLKSPLISIEGFSRLLRDDVQNQETERVQEDIRLIESAVKKMTQFINVSLEYSRAGSLVNPSANVSFGRIAKKVITELGEQLRSVGATVSLADTFPKIFVDKMRISEVLTNLIQNSIKYRDEKRSLNIDIGYQLSGNDVVLYVRDNGIGIVASEAEEVFELFYKGTTDREGSGAGLAIVKRIIEAHAGKVWVEGEVGNGTTIYFTLPQKRNTDKVDKGGKD